MGGEAYQDPRADERPAIPLSRCWAALLHLESMRGLREHVQEAAEKKLYGTADAEYERYAEVPRETELVLCGPESARFESTADLIGAGLMRRTPALQAFLDRSQP